MIMSNMPPISPLLSSHEKAEHRRDVLINLLYITVIIVIAVLAIRYLVLWMMPFIFAFIVATILQRPLKWLVKKTKVSKKFFSVVLLVMIILLIATVVAFIAWRVVIGVTVFFNGKDNIQMIQDSIMNVTQSVQALIHQLSYTLSPEAVESLNSAVTNISGTFINLLGKAFTGAATFAVDFTTKLPMMLVGFIIWVIASIFLSIDYDKVINFAMRQIPERHVDLVNDTRSLCSNTVFKLLRAYMLLMSITFVELCIGFSIVHIPYAIPPCRAYCHCGYFAGIRDRHHPYSVVAHRPHNRRLQHVCRYWFAVYLYHGYTQCS